MEYVPQPRLEYKKEYNRLYYQQNKAKLTDRLWCSTCHGTLNYYNHTNHIRTQKHIRAEARSSDQLQT